jgi:lysine 6-dehydrogenase
MKVLVLGAGLMGKEAVRDLVKSEKVNSVVLADIDIQKANVLLKDLKSDKCSAAMVNAEDEEQLTKLFKGFDVVINALFYIYNFKVAKAATRAGTSLCDLGGHIGSYTDQVLSLHDKAKNEEITIIPDLGVAPGMINILTGYGASQLDEVENIYLRVGGIPLRPEPPLEYNQVFSMEGVFDHYTDPSLIVRNGHMSTIPSLTEVEPIYFEKFAPLEAFHTAGGTSTISKTFTKIKNLDYKTIRYKGHAEKMQLLVDLNLTKNDHFVDVDGKKVKVRDVILKAINPIVKLNGKDDVVLLRVIVEGMKHGERMRFEYEMVTYNDRETQVTAMARSTAYTISVVAQLIGEGVISKRGAFPPEQIVPGETYINEMAKRGVYIMEKRTNL